MTRAYPANYKAMERVMQHVLSTPNHGVIMQPDTSWDGNEAFLLLWMVCLIPGMRPNPNLGITVGVYRCS